MRPAEFEALGGRSGNKKWKQSIRIAATAGSSSGEGPSVETWLERHGWSTAPAGGPTQSPRAATPAKALPTKVQPARPIKKPRRLLDGVPPPTLLLLLRVHQAAGSRRHFCTPSVRFDSGWQGPGSGERKLAPHLTDLHITKAVQQGLFCTVSTGSVG